MVIDLIMILILKDKQMQLIIKVPVLSTLDAEIYSFQVHITDKISGKEYISLVLGRMVACIVSFTHKISSKRKYTIFSIN